ADVLELDDGRSSDRPIAAGNDTRQIVANDGRAPPGLDVLDDQLGAARVTDERARARIVHGIGQVARQHHLKSQPCHLPNAEGSVENADVRVHAHQDHVGDAFLPEEVVDLLSVFAYAIEADDID